MAELNVDEAQRLARLFLTGLASKEDVQRLQAALPDDQTLALELLAQVQTALDDVAPEGLDSAQAQSVAARIAALVAPRVKRRGFLSLFKRLFRARPPAPPAEARVSRRGAPAAAPAPAPPVAADLDEGGGLEDMAPIAPAADAARVPEPASEPLEDAPPPPRAAGPARRAWLVWAGLGLLLVAGALYLAGRQRQVAPPAKPIAAVASVASTPPATPRPAPTPLPSPGGPIRRESALGPARNGPLPAALPPTTPQSASQLQ